MKTWAEKMFDDNCCNHCKNDRLNLTEAYFPESIWIRLRPGMTIRYRKSGKKTTIIKASGKGCLKVESGSTYCKCDRWMFLPIMD